MAPAAEITPMSEAAGGPDESAPPDAPVRHVSWRESLRGGWLDGGDREKIFNDSASAATEAGVPYWLLLLLAGAIAALGLALNSAAVVIGAMLIAPLLSPVIGLALSLAMGDGRLAVETLIIVLTSTLAVIRSVPSSHSRCRFPFRR